MALRVTTPTLYGRRLASLRMPRARLSRGYPLARLAAQALIAPSSSQLIAPGATSTPTATSPIYATATVAVQTPTGPAYAAPSLVNSAYATATQPTYSPVYAAPSLVNSAPAPTYATATQPTYSPVYAPTSVPNPAVMTIPGPGGQPIQVLSPFVPVPSPVVPGSTTLPEGDRDPGGALPEYDSGGGEAPPEDDGGGGGEEEPPPVEPDGLPARSNGKVLLGLAVALLGGYLLVRR